MLVSHRGPRESRLADRAAAVGAGSLSAARFFEFLGFGMRPEGDGVNGTFAFFFAWPNQTALD